MEETLAARDLIERAFRLAKHGGKPDWWIMAVPVLKNRLLQLTSGSFKEADFAALSFRDFLQQNAETIRIDEGFSPHAVILRAAESEPSQSALRVSHQRELIRPDLWRAILDYSSGNRYEWNPQTNSAQLALTNREGPFLPTISPEEMNAWRADFLETKAAKFAKSERLTSWQNEGLPTVALPVALRPAWNKYLKHQVQYRLKDWFEQHNVPAPTITEIPPAPNLSSTRTEELRRFVIECVRLMSNEELERLQVPASVALRAR